MLCSCLIYGVLWFVDSTICFNILVGRCAPKAHVAERGPIRKDFIYGFKNNKSLSGQIERARRGKPYLLFVDGTLSACESIRDDDLGAYLADCLDDDSRRNRILPSGGPGPAITPRQQGEHVFALLGRTPRFKQVPLGMLDAIIAVLAAAGRFGTALADKAELVRMGRYYASESMLLLDPATGRYDAGDRQRNAI